MAWLSDNAANARLWLGDHAALGWWLFGLSAVASIGGIFLVRWLVLAIPHDYFSRGSQPIGWRVKHPVARWSLFIGKNIVGVILLVLGVTMLVTPGPGIVTLLIALVLLDVPGKRALERRIVGMPTVLDVINRMRARANRPAIQPPN